MNLQNYKLIRFSDGTFGIRRGWIWFLYLDFDTPNCWWGKNAKWFNDCKTDEEQARNRFKNILLKDEVIK